LRKFRKAREEKDHGASPGKTKEIEDSTERVRSQIKQKASLRGGYAWGSSAEVFV